jgi:hypothetical protein
LKEQYNILLQKLDLFIRKYYKNQLIRGGIYFLSLLIVFFIVVNLFEFYGHFNIIIRTIIFYLYLALNAAIFILNILFPSLKLFRIGKIITNEQAAEIIGNHFPNVNDKLLNTLQLKDLSVNDTYNIELIRASIEQKIHDLKPISFGLAIDFNKNRKYLKYAVPPLLILLIILFTSPSIITEPTKRLVNHNTYFEREQPFKFVVMNDKLEAIQYGNFKLQIKAEGEEIPDQVFLEFDNDLINMNKENPINFSYSFQNIQKSMKFRLVADKFKSEVFTLIVLPKPSIIDFEIQLDYPEYTGKKDETINNTGDIILPIGTTAGWKFFTKNTDNITLRFKEKSINLEHGSSNSFEYKDAFFENQNYLILSSNAYLTNQDSLMYSIQAIPDLYPSITAEEFRDSAFLKQLFFKGLIKDDYGFSKLTFNYKINEVDNAESPIQFKKIEVNRTVSPQQFYYNFDLADLNIKVGGSVEYYFEIWDNDAINGSKSSRSQIMEYRLPTLEEINKHTEESNKSIKDQMEEAIREAHELQDDVEQLNKKMIDKKELSWDDKQQIQSVIQKHQELHNKIESINKENEEKARQEEEFKEIDQSLAEKQKQLEDLFDKLSNNEEFKKLMEDLKKLLEQVDKDKVNEMLEQMKLSNKDLEKMLARNLEIFKQLEFESTLEETIDDLNKLAEKQDQLSEETNNKNADKDELRSEQKKINEEFQSIKDNLNKLDELNSQLEEPNNFDKMSEKQEEVDQELNISQTALEKNQRNKASGSQKNASQKMQEMSEKLSGLQQEMIEEGMSEDIDALRDILENLIQLSFNQEDLMDKVNQINPNDPNYNNLVRDQKNIKDDLKSVEDSLYALSKRQIMIEPFISKELNVVHQNIDRSIEYLNNHRLKQSAEKQQFVMTSVNNLALMLSETLEQMMQSLMQQSSSNSSCKNGKPKPGSGKTSMKSMRQLQEELNKQMQKMNSGKNEDGNKKPGQKGNTSQSMSEQLARMAAEQEAIRNQMQKYADQLEKEGSMGASKELKKIMNEMEKTEVDLVNKKLSQETLIRQQEILTRLLNSEKADLEREQEEKRESTEAKNKYNRNPDEILEYKGHESNELELLKTMPPAMKPFYKSKVSQYFINFDELLEK